MSEQRDEHIKALIELHTALRRRESNREAASQRGRVPQAELEMSLPPTCRCTSVASA